MANSNVNSNGNQEPSITSGNELLYFTAESDILNVSNDSVNQGLFKINENINCSTLPDESFTLVEKSDSNCNPVDLSFEEKFAQMRLSNDTSMNDVTMKTMSCSSEPPDNKLEEQVPKDNSSQEPCSKPIQEDNHNSYPRENSDVNVSSSKIEVPQSPIKEFFLENKETQSPPVNSSEKVFKKNVDDHCRGDVSPVVGGISQKVEETPSCLNNSAVLDNTASPNFTPKVEESPSFLNNSAILGKTTSPNFSRNVKESPPSLHDSAVLDKISPKFSGSMLSERALTYIVGDSANDFSSSLPDGSKSSHNVTNPEVNSSREDIEVFSTPKVATSTQGDDINDEKCMNDDNLFKVPAIPVKSVEPEYSLPVNASTNSTGENNSILNAREVSGLLGSCVPQLENMSIGQCLQFDGRKDLFSGDLLNKSEIHSASSGLPKPMVFTDFSQQSNDIDNNPFKVPEPPKDEEDEEFTDAVQFFKDPTSFQYLENIQTSVPAAPVPRSSLYVAFDPLHSKRASVSQMQSTSVVQLASETEVDKGFSTPIKKHLAEASLRESLGVLISFDSPKPSVKVEPAENEPPASVTIAKVYTEEELQQILKIHELTMQETYLKTHRELEQELAKERDKVEKLSSLVVLFRNSMEEMAGVAKSLASQKEELEKQNEKLQEDVKTAGEDLHSVENTFSDFHKRYEQCKGMLKTYKENEVHLKAKLSEQEQKYNTLQEQSHEALEKANFEATNAKKSSEGQVTVLKAQLKKAELKISSLESDLSQVKIENSKLGGICDDLMAKVSEG